MGNRRGSSKKRMSLPIAKNEVALGKHQRQISVSRPGDRAEKEADRIADQVAGTSATFSEETHGAVQRAGTGAAGSKEHEEALPKDALHALGHGRPLDPDVRDPMESRFGHDFSRVRIYTDSEAAEHATAVDARAFTVGNRIAFGRGQYAPETQAGRRLIAHELAHTVQQRASVNPVVIQRQVAPQPQGQQQPQPAPPPDPAQAEWDAHPNIHPHFANGYQTYTQLRPLYQAQGIQNPADYLDTNIVTVTFFGRSTPAHQDMRAPLQAAQQNLTNQNIAPAITSFWAFVPRATAGGALSNHALGKAVDINPGENPHIQNAHDIRVIRAVTGVDLGAAQTAAAMRTASQTFQATFTQQWVDQQTQQLQQLQGQQNPTPAVQQQIQVQQQLVNSITARRAVLDGYAQSGFLNLEQALIDALTGAGLSWGGQWQHEKDSMHFEL